MQETGAPRAEVHPRLSAVAYIRALPRRSQVAAGCAGVVFAAGCFARFGLSAHALIGAILSVVLVVLTAIDLQRRLLPDVIVASIGYFLWAKGSSCRNFGCNVSENARPAEFFAAEHCQCERRCRIVRIEYDNRSSKKSACLLKRIPRAL